MNGTRSAMLVVLGVFGSVAACGEGGLDTAAECNPLGDGPCLTPWPTAIYEIEDASTATGMRLDVAPGAWPANWEEVPIDPAPFNTRDGFTPAKRPTAKAGALSR